MYDTTPKLQNLSLGNKLGDDKHPPTHTSTAKCGVKTAEIQPTTATTCQTVQVRVDRAEVNGDWSSLIGCFNMSSDLFMVKLSLDIHISSLTILLSVPAVSTVGFVQDLHQHTLVAGDDQLHGFFKESSCL